MQLSETMKAMLKEMTYLGSGQLESGVLSTDDEIVKLDDLVAFLYFFDLFLHQWTLLFLL